MTECNNDAPIERVLSQDDAVSFHDTLTRMFGMYAGVIKDSESLLMPFYL